MTTANGYMPFVYGSYMATMDVFMLGLIKIISQNKLAKEFMAIPSVLYALQPWVFLRSLKYESMTVMNLMWDVLSDILVTLTGLFFFEEKLTRTKKIGVIFAVLSVIMMNCGDLCD
jgi:multidrug transporter EmrE-like cation transporter